MSSSDADVLLFAETMRFPEEVELAIAQAFPSDDPMDKPDFDAISLINDTFPTEQSLVDLDPFLEKLNAKIRQIDREIQAAVRSQSQLEFEGKQALADAHRGMDDLFMRIKDIHDKAELSEKMVQEITRDIKSLDYAKHHLTSSITTLNHLHMLVGGIDSLTTMTKARQYRDAANLLAAVTNVMEHLAPYVVIDRVKHLADDITKIKRTLARQIMTEFQEAFGHNSVPDRTAVNPSQLNEACLVLDVLEPDVKIGFLEWFLDLQIAEYRTAYDQTKQEEQAWLDKIDKRYSFIKKSLAAFREACGDIFPAEWYLLEQIARRYCEVTKEELEGIIAAKYTLVDVKLLLSAFKHTTTFERWLGALFKDGLRANEEVEVVAIEQGVQEQEADEQVDEAELSEADRIRLRYRLQKRKEKEEKEKLEEAKRAEKRAKEKQSQTPVHRAFVFSGFISQVFERCMSVYIIAQDDALQKMMEDFSKNLLKQVGLYFADDSANADKSDIKENKMLPTCTDLFLFFKNSIAQCTQLSVKQPLLDLFRVFKKFLGLYAERILLEHLPKIQVLNQAVAKEREVIIQLTQDEICVICIFLNTAEYCLQTINQLQEKLKDKIDEAFKEKIDFSEEHDKFVDVCAKSITLLMRALETACDPLLVAMTKIQWSLIEEVGDSSPFIAEIARVFRSIIPSVRANLAATSTKYFTQLCLKFADSFIAKVIVSIYKCRNVSGVGTEQLLLDMQSLRGLLLELPCVESLDKAKPPNYTRIVTTLMRKAELIPKVIMTPHDDPRLFVEDFALKLPEEDKATLRSVLEMMGVKRADQGPYVDLFMAMHANDPTHAAAASSSTADPTQRSKAAKAVTAVSETTSKGVAAISQGLSSAKRKVNIDKIIKRFNRDRTKDDKEPPKS